MNKITSRPPKQKSSLEFIRDAEKRGVEVKDVKENYPWNNKSVRNDVKKVFTVKLLEEYIIKIKYVSEVTNISQQQIVREIINSGIDKMLDSLKDNW